MYSTYNPLTVGLMWRINQMSYFDMMRFRRGGEANLEYLTGEVGEYFNQCLADKRKLWSKIIPINRVSRNDIQYHGQYSESIEQEIGYFTYERDHISFKSRLRNFPPHLMVAEKDRFAKAVEEKLEILKNKL